MPEYDVVITATITKTIRVSADNKTEAAQSAHEQFSTQCDGDEDYKEETRYCTEIKKTIDTPA